MPGYESRALNAQLRQRVFRAARAYHASLARYARAVAAHAEVDRAAQEMVGTGFHYQIALEGYLRYADADHLPEMRERILRLRRLLHAAARQYDALRKAHRRVSGGLGAGW